MFANTIGEQSRKAFSMQWRPLLASALLTAIACVLMTCFVAAQEPSEKTFANPDDASKALNEAVKSADRPAMLAVLGQSASSVVASGDDVQDKNNNEFFLKRFAQMNRWGSMAKGEKVLYIGAENWPFPMPLRKNAAGQWYFDSKAGAQEVLFRRIGKNEIAAIRV